MQGHLQMLVWWTFLVEVRIDQHHKTQNEEKLQINISGDGTKITRISNFIVISLIILSTEKGAWHSVT